MAEVSVTAHFNQPANIVWQSIQDFGGIDKIMLGTTVTVEGEGLGAVRTITQPNGGIVRETLKALDNASYTMQYMIHDDAPLPITQHLSTMHLDVINNNECKLTWTAVYEPSIPAEKVDKIMRGILNYGIDGLQKLHAQGENA